MKSKNSAKTNIIWHRRLGLSIFLVLIFLAISGIALNHSPALKLSKTNLTSNWLLSWYGLEKPAIKGFELNNYWLYQGGNNHLYVNSEMVAPCAAPLLSAVSDDQYTAALCADALVLLTTEGQLLESFSQLDGLPVDARALAAADNKLYLLTDSAVMEFDPDSFVLTATDLTNKSLLLNPAVPSSLPRSLEQQFENAGPSISLETVILDLHSGRFFGNFGVLFMDIVGLLVCILSITGLVAWIGRLRQTK